MLTLTSLPRKSYGPEGGPRATPPKQRGMCLKASGSGAPTQVLGGCSFHRGAISDRRRFGRACASGRASGAGSDRTTTARCACRVPRSSPGSATRLPSAPRGRRATVAGQQHSAGGMPCAHRKDRSDDVTERLDRISQGILGRARPAVVSSCEAGERLPALGDQQRLARACDILQQRETPPLERRDRH